MPVQTAVEVALNPWGVGERGGRGETVTKWGEKD